MGAALGWGAVAASSLIIGVLLAFARQWPREPIGLILAFGAGALISAVSFWPRRASVSAARRLSASGSRSER